MNQISEETSIFHRGFSSFFPEWDKKGWIIVMTTATCSRFNAFQLSILLRQLYRFALAKFEI